MKKILFVALLFITAGGLFFYKNFRPKTEDSSRVLQVGENIIYVAEQKPGSSVSVDFASMIKEGYVVIYDNDNGRFGKIIGNSKVLPKGESSNISIGLIRPTINGEFLFAMLHEDNGDGTFSPNIDVPLRDQDGNIMYMFFGVNPNASGSSIINL